MIPKVIHYCWFGNSDKPELIKKCIESWKKYCPDYEIIEWNESNFDINSIPYVAQAYADKKWAFVSDYVRLYAVYNQGGIYLDTDVLLHHGIDDLLQYRCWLASDDVRYIATGLGFGAEKGNTLIQAMMNAYKNYEYPSGTNVIRDTKIMERELPQWKKSDKSQIVSSGGGILIIGLKDYGKYATHLYTYTWADEEAQRKREAEIINKKKNRIGIRLVWKIKCAVRSPKIIAYFDNKRGSKSERIYTFLAYDFLDYGLIYFVKRLAHKVIRKKCS